MEKLDAQHILVNEDLAPPVSTHTSVVLNGAGNGMMLGTLPFVGLEMYAKIAEKELPKNAYKGMAFMLVAGCALGAAFGIREARQINSYREAVGNEISKLNARVTETNAKLDGWAKKHEAEQAAPEQHVR